MAFKMNGFPTHRGTSMAATEAAKNLLKAVPNEDAYNKLSDIDKEGFDVAAKKAGLPTKPSIARQTYTTPEMNKESNDAEMELNKSKASGTSTKEQQDRYDKAAAGFIQKNTEDNDRRKAEGRSVFPQKVVKEGEGQDQNKIFDEKGNHIGDYVNGKKVMLSQEQIEDARGVTTNIKTPKVMRDGPKNTVHGIDLGKDPHWQPYQAKKKK